MKQLLELITWIKVVGPQYFPIIVATVVDAVRAIEEVKAGFDNGQAKKSAAMDLVRDAFTAINFFKPGAKQWEGQTMELVSRLIDFLVAGYNITGLWGVKLDLSNLPKKGKLKYKGGKK